MDTVRIVTTVALFMAAASALGSASSSQARAQGHGHSDQGSDSELLPKMNAGIPADPCLGGPGTTLLFGPETFRRTAASPRTIKRTFVVPQQADPLIADGEELQSFCVRAVDSGNVVASARVSIDGAPLLGSSDFNHGMNTVEKRPTLQPGSHDLSVRLGSAPGSDLTLEIRGSGDGPFPALSVGSKKRSFIAVNLFDAREPSSPDLAVLGMDVDLRKPSAAAPSGRSARKLRFAFDVLEGGSLRTVRTLSGEQDATLGTQRLLVRWDGSGENGHPLPPGPYLYRASVTLSSLTSSGATGAQLDSLTTRPSVLTICTECLRASGVVCDADTHVCRQRGQAALLVVAGHGGTESVKFVCERERASFDACPAAGQFNGFVLGGDSRTDELAWRIAGAIQQELGLAPYVVVANFQRRLADTNRGPECSFEPPPPDGTCGGALAIPGDFLFEAYHDQIARFVSEIRREFGGGLIVDVHSNGNKSLVGDVGSTDPIEWGYLSLGTINSNHASLEPLWSSVDDRETFLEELSARLADGFDFDPTGNPLLDAVLALFRYSSRLNAIENGANYTGAYTVRHYSGQSTSYPTSEPLATIQMEFNGRVFGRNWGGSSLDPVDRSAAVAHNVGDALASVYLDLVLPSLP